MSSTAKTSMHGLRVLQIVVIVVCVLTVPGVVVAWRDGGDVAGIGSLLALIGLLLSAFLLFPVAWRHRDTERSREYK